ncbi:MAG: gliding motility-associated C-terminal domain-containing protein [Bacteroidetes bacterium]|nr:gliding motility-associated C-terminal domain-containing protein [Bacteroidota bacterium]
MAFPVFILSFCWKPVSAQFVIPVTPSTNSIYQNFDTPVLPSAGSIAWTDNVTIPNWWMQRVPVAGGTGPFPITVTADNGSNNTGSAYNYGTTGSTDRALGSVGSNNAASGNYAWGIQFQNTTGYNVSDFKVAYRGEQWRDGGVVSLQKITFAYKKAAALITNLNPSVNTTWTTVAALNFPVQSNTSTAGPLNGNLPAYSLVLSSAIPAITMSNNDYLMMKWDDPKWSGATDDGMSSDSVVISWVVCAPPVTQASVLSSSASGLNNITLNWVNGSGSGRIVKINTVNNFTDPADGSTQTANPVYSGSGEQVVYNGSGPTNSVNVTGLLPCLTYWFKVYEYNCSGANSKYNNALAGTGNPLSFTTAGTVPSQFLMSGPTSYCSSNVTGIPIGMQNTQTGVRYQLTINCPVPNTPVGTPILGTGSTITFGNQLLPGAATSCTYKVIATDTTHTTCQATMNDSLVVTVIPTPTVTVAGVQPVCPNNVGSITLSLLTPNTVYDVNYNDPSGTAVALPGQNSGTSGIITIGPLAPGTYNNISVTLNGCTSLTYPVTLNALPIIAIPAVTISSPLVCSGEADTLTATGCTGNLTWYWNTGSIQTSSPFIINPTMTTSYWARCSSAAGCLSEYSDTLTVTVKPLPAITGINAFPPSTCGVNDGSIVLTVNPANSTYLVNFSIDGVPQPQQTIPAIGNQLTISNLGGGNYTGITITLDGCTSMTQATNLFAPGGPNSPTITVSPLVICEGQPLTLSASCSDPNGMIHWSNGDSTSLVITYPSAGTHYYSATCKVGNCSSVSSAQDTVIVNPKPATPTISTYATTICSGLADTLTIGGCAGTPVWSTNSATPSITVTPSTNTTYWVACKSSDNCNSDTVYQAITVKPSPTFTVITPHETTSCGSSTGYFTIENLPAAFTYYSIDYTDINGNPVHDSIRTNGSNQLIVQNLPAGTYNNITVSQGGCSSISSATSISDPNPPAKPAINAASHSICLGETIRLTASGCAGGTITWSPTFQTGSFIDVSPNDTTTYFTQCTDATGCKSPKSDDFILDVKPLPAIISIDTTGAINGQNGSAVISIVNSGFRPLSYSWDNPGSWILSDSSHTGLTSGTHYIKVKDQNGCVDSTSYQINFIPASSVFLSADSSAACPGDIITLNMIGTSFNSVQGVHICISYDDQLAEYVDVINVAPQFANYQVDNSVLGKIDFFDNITNPITIQDGDTLFSIRFLGLISGTQHLTLENFKPTLCGVKDINGNSLNVQMQNQGTLNFLASPDPAINGKTDVCLGAPIALTAKDNTATNVWTLPDGSTLTQPGYTAAAATNANSGKYVLEVTNSFTCTSKDSVTLVIHPLPVVSIQPSSPSKILCVESVPSMTPGSNYTTYTWQDSSTVAIMPNQGEGKYLVIVTDNYGCKGLDSLTLVSCPTALYIPNAFSPNNDTYNDTFKAVYTDQSTGLDNFKMYIYNRWGQLVFEGNSLGAAWDGKFKGAECPVGVYTYMISFDKPIGKTFAQESPIRGIVTLVR